jgi:hypothetical protein
MAYDVLSKLKAEGRLFDCVIEVADESLPGKKKAVFGKDVIELSRSNILFLGGETGHERISVPIESVLEIFCSDKVLFRKKRRIDRIYPR